MKTTEKRILEAVEAFFQEGSGEVIDYLEAMLSEWYVQTRADRDDPYVSQMVNKVFQVNDLLLKLQDAMIAYREAQGADATSLESEHYDFRFAS